VLLHEVIGDQVVPNAVATGPLSGTEPYIRTLGLTQLTGPTQDANGIRGFVRFTAGDHGTLLSPAASPAATVEMQTQMASMIVSGGTAVSIVDTSVIQTQ